VFLGHAVSYIVILLAPIFEGTEMAGFFLRAALDAPAMEPDFGFRRCYRNGGIPAIASTSAETGGEQGNQQSFRIAHVGTFVNEDSYPLLSPTNRKETTL
jgi:hypothetical protein